MDQVHLIHIWIIQSLLCHMIAQSNHTLHANLQASWPIFSTCTLLWLFWLLYLWDPLYLPCCERRTLSHPNLYRNYSSQNPWLWGVAHPNLGNDPHNSWNEAMFYQCNPQVLSYPKWPTNPHIQSFMPHWHYCPSLHINT